MDLPTFASIGPEIWGRSLWEFLDAILATFPRDNPTIEHRNAVYDLMQSLRYILPCPDCRKHYNEFLNRHSLDQALVSRRSFIEFYFLLKRDVASRTNHNFPFKSPTDLWLATTRRLKLTKATPQSSTQQILQKARHNKPFFRIPGRTNNTATKKGCGCGKK